MTGGDPDPSERAGNRAETYQCHDTEQTEREAEQAAGSKPFMHPKEAGDQGNGQWHSGDENASDRGIDPTLTD